MIHTSPALMVDKETPILDCVKWMNAQKVGSLLVVDDLNGGKLVGIFTERDLLKHYVELAERPKETRPVRTVMTRDIKTLPISRIKEAPKVMLEGGFRHLPIVAGGSGAAAQQILGVLSMRDLFKICIEQPESFLAPTETPIRKRPGTKKSSIPPRLELHSKDFNIKTLFKKVLQVLEQQDQDCSLMDRTGMSLLAESQNYLVLDLDDLEKSEWVPLLRTLNQSETPPYTILIYSPANLREVEQAALKKLSKSDHFEAFSKPVDVVALIQCLLSGHA